MHLSNPLQGLVGVGASRLLRRLAMVSGGLSGRQVAELANVPTTSANRALKELVSVGLVLSEEVGRSRLYVLNRDHVLWDPIERVLAAPLRIEQQIGEVVREVVGDRATAAVYGSFARRDADADSDIDIAVIWDDSVDAEERSVLFDQLHHDIGLATGNTVDLVDLTQDEVDRMIAIDDPLIRSWRDEARTVAGMDLKSRLKRTPS